MEMIKACSHMLVQKHLRQTNAARYATVEPTAQSLFMTGMM